MHAVVSACRGQEPKVAYVIVVEPDTCWKVSSHAHTDNLELVLVCGGRGTLYYGNDAYPLKTGDLRVYNQGTLHGEESDERAPLHEISIGLQGVELEGLEPNCLLPQGTAPVFDTGARFTVFHALFSLLRDSFTAARDADAAVVRDASRLLVSLVGELVGRGAEPIPQAKPDFPVAQEVAAYLDANFRRSIQLKDLENEFHFCRFYLARKFKEEIGCTINEYLTNRRLGEAGKLLIFTDMSVSEVARLVGYDNLSHFSAAFKKHMGLSPNKMKLRHERLSLSPAEE